MLKKTKELIQVPITRIRARRIKGYDDGIAKGLMSFVEETMTDGVKFKMEEDGDKPPMLLMIIDQSKEQLLE